MHHQPNFLRKERSIRPLQAATLAALIGCATLTGLLLHGNRSPQTAAINDTLASPSPSSAPIFQSTPLPRAISESATAGAARGTDGDSIRYYEKETGKAFWIELSTMQTHALSDQRLPGFLRSLWVPDHEQVVSEFQKGVTSQYRSFDYQTKQAHTIGQGTIRSVAVSPDGRSLAYIEDDGTTATIVVSAPDGTDPRVIMETRAQDAQINWKDNATLSLLSKRTDRPGKDLSVIDLTGHLSILLSGRENLEYAWSPDGTRLLFSYFTAEQGVSLWETTGDAVQEIPLGLATSAQKCAWHADNITITCGIPTRNGLTRDVAANKTATLDEIITIDGTTGIQTPQYAAISGTLLGVIDPMISASQQYFVFTNLFDGRLYALKLR